MVVELHPQAGKQFLRLFGCQRSVVESLLVERHEVLVDVPGVHGVPSVEFGDGAEMYEPIHLDGLPQVAWSVSRHVVAHVGDFQQFRLALRVTLLSSHLIRQQCVSLGEEDGGVARDVHGPQFLLLVGGLRVVDVVERLDASANPLLHVEESLPVHLPVHGGMSRRPLLHELREDAGMVGLLPLLGDMAENAFPLRLPLPVRDDNALVGVDVLLTDVVRLEGAFVERVQVVHGVAGQFGEGRDGLRPRPPLAHNQFVRADIYGLFLADFEEVGGSQDGDGHGAVMFLVKLRLDERTLDGERDGRVDALLPEASYAGVHALVVFRVSHDFFIGEDGRGWKRMGEDGRDGR